MIKRVRRLPGGTYRLRSDGAVPCMELPSHIPNDLDYDWYVHKAETMLCNMGAIADSPVHVECTTSKRSEEHTSELQSLMRISYAVFCLKKKTTPKNKLIPIILKIQKTTRTHTYNSS